jgi:predicted ribosome quality control (RQC) complex YloA/Tae2 family protein
MANLHIIPERATQVNLFNFYTNQEEVIRLKEQLSPQKNAEVYYRKAKNHNIEIQKQEELITAKRQELAQKERQISEVKAIEKLKELRKYLKAEGLSQSRQQEAEFPFRRFEADGYEIWVGKSARNNDLLTQRYAFKEDLWLHARDVSGSHVIVKYRSGRNFPAHVIEQAAQIAAWYSKRKHDTLCPVIYTPKKFVRKPKGAAEGQVIVDKETVIMVTPHLPA